MTVIIITNSDIIDFFLDNNTKCILGKQGKS